MARGLKALQSKMCGSGINNKIRGKMNSLMGKLGLGKGFRNFVQGFRKSLTGDPVDVATGAVVSSGEDFELPGPIPFKWERSYHSSSSYNGPIGYGWNHPYDMALISDEEDQLVVIRLHDGRYIVFPWIEPGDSSIDKSEQLVLLRDEHGFYLRNLQDRLYYRFTDDPIQEQEIHLLAKIESPSGHKITFRYDKQARLSQITDSAGRILKVQSNDQGKIEAIHGPHPTKKDSSVVLVSYLYDEEGDLIEVLDALEQPFLYVYERHLMVQRTLRTGLSFHFEYDSQGPSAYCTRTWGDGGIYHHKLTYFKDEGYTIVEDSLKNRVIYYHNEIGMVYKTVYLDERNQPESSEIKHFGPDEELLAEINEMGEITRYGYDDWGNTTFILQPDGTSINLKYDESGLLTKAIDTLGGKWEWEYDEQEQPIRRVNCMGRETHYTYEAGLLSRIIDTEGHATTLNYDAQGNLISLTTPDQQSSFWQYDLCGRRINATDPKGNRQHLTYDLKGRVIQVQEPDGNERHLTYDPEGNITRAKDHQYDVRFEYGGFNKLKARIEAGTRVNFRYDTEDQLIAIVNEHGKVYEFDLDAKGNVEIESGFDGIKTLL